MKSTSSNADMGVVSSTSRTEPASQMSFYSTGPNSQERKAPSRTSTRVLPRKTSHNGSQSGSSTQTHDSVQVVIPLTSHNGRHEVPVDRENEANDEETSGSEHIDSGDNSDEHSEEDAEESSEHQAEDIDDVKGKTRDIRHDHKLKPDTSDQMLEVESKDANNNLKIRVKDTGRNPKGDFKGLEPGFPSEPHDAEDNHEARSSGHAEGINGKYNDAEEELDIESGHVTDQSDTNDEDSESEPDATQEQLDNQLTQSSQSVPTPRKQPFSPERKNISPNQDMEAKDLREKLPSLRRNLQEIKQTSQAKQEASKARAFANAQLMKDDAIDSNESDGSSDDGSTTDQSSSSSKNAADAGDRMGAKIRKELSSKIAELGHTASPPPETNALTPHSTFPRKETRILPPVKQISHRQDKKIGFGKLARQFTAKRP